MKIRITKFCPKCFDEAGKTKEAYNKLNEEIKGKGDWEVEVNNEGIYSVTCSKGHKTYTQLHEEQFEILFDIGALALLDGYTKESVSTISSAVERCIEFFIRAVCLGRSINFDSFLETWKLIVKQSERQLGAFYILQLIEFGETKFILDNDKVGFRNKVIHQGYIPTLEEAIQYGEYALTLITSMLKTLHERLPQGLEQAKARRLTTAGMLIGPGFYRSLSSMPTIVRLNIVGNTSEFGMTTFRDAIKEIRSNGFYKYFYVRNISLE